MDTILGGCGAASGTPVLVGRREAPDRGAELRSRCLGVSVSVVARRYDVNANLIFTWRRDPRYRPAADAGEAPSFLPVEVVPDAPPLEPAAASDGRIEIALSNGHRVSAFGSFDADALCRVVRALGG